MGKSKLPIVWVDGRCVFFVEWLVYEIITAKDKEKAAMQTDMILDIHIYTHICSIYVYRNDINVQNDNKNGVIKAQ